MKTGAIQSFAECGSELNNEAKEFVNKSREFANTATAEMRRTGRRVQVAAEDAVKEGRHEIKEHPLTAVSLAVAGGLALGFFSGFMFASRRK
jgi:ElaB/YqjD/DUF883 family membrane-anchored ribosome-binding protein